MVMPRRLFTISGRPQRGLRHYGWASRLTDADSESRGIHVHTIRTIVTIGQERTGQMIQNGALHDIDELSRTLDQHLYTDDALYQREMTWMRKNMWFLVGHESRIPRPGDYFLFDFEKDNVIVIRDQSGQIRAHHNVCTHRGSRLCKESTGSAKVITCPYHAWSFDLNGALRAAPFVSSSFDKSQWGLAGCHVRVLHGFVFLSFSDIAADFDEYIGYAD